MAEETKKSEIKPEIIEEKKAEIKPEEKKGAKKEPAKKKSYALVNGNNIHLSTKYGAHICDMIRYKKIDDAIKIMEDVSKMRRAVRMNNREVGHRKGIGIMAGRFPVDASKEFIKLLKNLKANAIHNELELENCILTQCMTNKASKPYKRGGSRMKRSHVTLKLEINKKPEAKAKEKGGKKEKK